MTRLTVGEVRRYHSHSSLRHASLLAEQTSVVGKLGVVRHDTNVRRRSYQKISSLGPGTGGTRLTILAIAESSEARPGNRLAEE